MRQAAKGIQELQNGVSLTFPPDSILFRDVAEWISLERRCCPFLEFALE